MYGNKQGTDGVYINGPNIKLDLPSEFVYYAWHRVVYLIPHPLQLPSSNFTLAIFGIGSLVDALNSTNPDIIDSPQGTNPDGNTLLHMFGTYLFDAASRSSQADHESQYGCAESLLSLIHI